MAKDQSLLQGIRGACHDTNNYRDKRLETNCSQPYLVINATCENKISSNHVKWQDFRILQRNNEKN